jgi:hypothetical protein
MGALDLLRVRPELLGVLDIRFRLDMGVLDLLLFLFS